MEEWKQWALLVGLLAPSALLFLVAMDAPLAVDSTDVAVFSGLQMVLILVFWFRYSAFAE